MTPDVSKAVGLVIDKMGLVPGPIMDELIDAAQDVDSPDKLPAWAVNVLAVVGDNEKRGRGREIPRSVAKPA